jgi:hypothetical protein
MENCLVRKLKGVVNNDNLEKLGIIRISIGTYESNSKYYISFNLGDTEHGISLLGDNNIVGTYPSEILAKVDNHHVNYLGTENTSINPLIQVEESGVAVLEIDNKYALKYFLLNDRCTSCAIKGGMKAFKSSMEYIDVGHYSEPVYTKDLVDLVSLKYFNLNNNFYSFNGNLLDLSVLTNVEVLWANSINNKVTGNITDIGNLINLKQIKFSGNTGVTGSIEEFVAAQRLAGRTIESTGIDFSRGMANVTFNGNSTLTNHACTLTWTADSITYDGVTISA